LVSKVAINSTVFSMVITSEERYRHKVAKAHRHKAKNNDESDMTLPLCHSVPLSLMLSVSADSSLLIRFHNHLHSAANAFYKGLKGGGNICKRECMGDVWFQTHLARP